MLVIPGDKGRATCDGMTRRELLRVGGSTMLGLSLADLLNFQQKAQADPAPAAAHGPGFGRARSIILLYLQGGPSHLDLWDPKENVPERVRSPFSTINTCLPGVRFTELLPRLGQVLDKTTLIRSMSYTPIGLFNHTAAIYQMMTGYQADAVGLIGPAGAADAARLSELRLQHHEAATAKRADPAVCDNAAPVAGKQRRQQGRHRGLPRPGVRSLLPVPGRRRHGHGQDGPCVGRRFAAARGGAGQPSDAPRPSSRRHQPGHARVGASRRPLRPAELLQPGAQPRAVGPGPRRLRPDPGKTR